MAEAVRPDFKVVDNFHGRALGGCRGEFSCGTESVSLKIAVVEWGDYKNHAAVIAFHKVSKLGSKIFTTLSKLKIIRMFVYRTIKQLTETGTVVDHLQHQDQEAGSNIGGPYSVKFCEKAVSDSSRAEHIKDVHVRCVKK